MLLTISSKVYSLQIPNFSFVQKKEDDRKDILNEKFTVSAEKRSPGNGHRTPKPSPASMPTMHVRCFFISHILLVRMHFPLIDEFSFSIENDALFDGGVYLLVVKMHIKAISSLKIVI